MSISVRRLARAAHKWLGLLLGLQVLVWLSSGLVMVLIPIEMVRGTAWVRQSESSVGERIAEFRIAPAALAQAAGPTSISAAIRLGEPVYLLHDGKRVTAVMHAGDGHPVPSLDASGAMRLARELHVEHPDALGAELVAKPGNEARGLSGPVWRVQLADRWNTRVYLDPLTARLLSVRNDLWRFYDFFWMLHILDFDEREDINNPLLRGTAVIAWFLGFSGIWLLFYSFGRGARIAPARRESGT